MEIKCYSELIRLVNFEERYRYLRLSGTVGAESFGFDRYLNQIFYKSSEWKSLRRELILRDLGCDLGVEDRPILGPILVHHMNPITQEDILQRSKFLLDPEFLICTSSRTHNAIHYGDESLLAIVTAERKKNDTCPWKENYGKHT